jgi:regulator of protease activity HflC (stomatin/prohibitin superfamily)
MQDFLNYFSTHFWKGLLILVVSLQLSGSFLFDIVRVNERQMAVITRLGQISDVKSAGWHFKIPWIDSQVATYDLSVQSVTSEASAATRDQQTVTLKINVQYKLDPTKAREIFRLVRDQEYLANSIVPPFVQESVKVTTAQFTASELLEKRDLVKTKVEETLQSRLKEYFANVVAVNIENIDWSSAFDTAIEAKVIAEQDALRKKQELEQAKIQSDIDITRAKAEAESTKIRGEALRSNPETLEKAKIDKWDGKLPQVQGNATPIIDINNSNK